MSSFFDEEEEVQPVRKQHRSKGPSSSIKNDPTSSSNASLPQQFLTSNRFAITAEDALVAEQQRRAAIIGQAAASAGSSQTLNETSLAASMEEAQRRREREREEALVQKLKRERREESNNPELVEKDLHVGVFVTDAYRAKLALSRRNESAASSGSNVLNRSNNNTAGDDDEDAISFTSTDAMPNGLASSVAQYYDTVMQMQLVAKHVVVADGADAAPTEVTRANSSGGEAVAPSTNTEAHSNGIDASATAPAHASTSGTVTVSVQEATLAAEQRAMAEKVREREARRHQRIDGDMLAMARQRFAERQRLRWNKHIEFFSLKQRVGM